MDALNKLWFGAKTMGIGLLVVFFGLVLLIAVIYLISYIIRKAQSGHEKPAPAPVPVVAAPVVIEEAEDDACDPALIAVMTAAIMAMEGSGKTLVVRSVRRLGGNAWAAAGRREQMSF